MKKYFIIILGLLLSPVLVGAISADQVQLNNVPDAYFFPLEFDKLVLDFTILSEDNLSSLNIRNEGSALNRYDIDKFTLWSDAGEEGFQGMGKDNKIGEFENSEDSNWEINDLNIETPSEGMRFFVSAETMNGATTNRYLQMRIIDWDLLNSGKQTLRAYNGAEDLAPVSVIDQVETITSENHTITGQARDQGGSTPAWVKICINDQWYNIEDTGANYSTWKYEWKNILEGTYTIKTQSADWIGNLETEGDEITVVVDFPDIEEPLVEEPPIIEEPPELTLEEQIRAQIKNIQEQIIDLLNQLIQIYLQELNSI